MSEDYAKGFKDGFQIGLEEGKKQSLNPINEWNKTEQFDPVWVTPTSIRETCPKCGMKVSGVMGYVCASPNCPTFPQVTCGVPMHGAVGSNNISYSYGTGANGPAGGLHDGLGKSFW